jgi:hypothetical protein
MIHFNMDHFFHSKIFAVDLFCNSNLKNVLQVELTGEFLYLLSDCLKNLINCAQNSYDLAICPYFFAVGFIFNRNQNICRDWESRLSLAV